MGRALGLLSACLGLLLAGSSLVAPAATGAPSTPTAIYVMVVPDLRTPVAGRPTDFTATLRDEGGSPIPGQLLTLWVQTAGSPDFVQAAQATTDSNGDATVWATLDRNAVAHWTYATDGVHDDSTSADFGVQIAPLVTARAHDRTLRRGQRLVVTGRTNPVKAGCRVSLWRGVPRPLTSGPVPKLLARSTARADGSYRLVRRLYRAAAIRVAVTVASCDGNARGLSRAIAIRVR